MPGPNRRKFKVWRHCWRLDWPKLGEFLLITPLFFLQTGCYTPEVYNPDAAWSGIKFALINPFKVIDEGELLPTYAELDWVWDRTNLYHEFIRRGY